MGNVVYVSKSRIKRQQGPVRIAHLIRAGDLQCPWGDRQALQN